MRKLLLGRLALGSDVSSRADEVQESMLGSMDSTCNVDILRAEYLECEGGYIQPDAMALALERRLYVGGSARV